jgi:diguanylate cyclase (GGDEF)-like protein
VKRGGGLVVPEQRPAAAEAEGGAGVAARGQAALVLDLDRFRVVNAAFGHAFGDRVLDVLAARLVHALPRDAHLRRLGGDQFAVLWAARGSPEAEEATGQRVLAAVRIPLRVADHELALTASAGLVVDPAGSSSPAVLLARAESALHAAKRAGRNRLVVYAADMVAAARERLEVIRDLHRALAGAIPGLRLVYQPQVDVRSGAVVGAEALLRWHHPVRGEVPPSRFVPLAEQAGLASDLGAFVRRQVLADLLRWHRAGWAVVPVAVNVSAVELEDPDFARRVAGALDAAGVPAAWLQLELTESAPLVGSAPGQLAALRRRGVRVFLDDFGRGHSTLERVRSLPCDGLKMDQLFLRAWDAPCGTVEPAVLGLVAGVVTLAHARGMVVVAEGVERSAQLAALREVGCDLYQGYLFSPGVDAVRFAACYLARR